MIKHMIRILKKLILGSPEPVIAKQEPLYEISSLSLAEKEKVLFDKIVGQHIDVNGCLLHELYLDDYLRSYDVADFPAWHGYWIASLAFKMAVEPSPETSSLLHSSIEAINESFKATGIDGLLPRSYLKHASDEPLSWMKLEDQRPGMYWQKGFNGYWFRNGPAKDQYCGVIFGLAAIIGLINCGDLSIQSETRSSLYATFIKLAHYLIDNDYEIIDVSGEMTEWGQLGSWWYNGYNALQILAMLRTGKAIRDGKCIIAYNKMVKRWTAKRMAITLGLLGTLYARIGRENALEHYSDDQSIYANAFVYWINSSDEDKATSKQVKYALAKTWKHVKYSRKTLMIFIHQIMIGASYERREQAIETLLLFPEDKRIINKRITTQTHEVQPICNQYISAHYWKSDYFRKAVRSDGSKRVNIARGGQDYLSAYWMGRYFGLIDA